jgi:hypothetical protein
MKIAVDSIALSSYVEKNLFLKEIEPSITEKYLIGALKEAGFDNVIQYDRFLLESIAMDTKTVTSGNKNMLSWCKAAFNYVQDRIPDSKLFRSEENAPWNLLFREESKDPICLLSPCTALKGVAGFKRVLSAMELDELFKKKEIDPEFSRQTNYQSKAKIGSNHPGFSPVEVTVEANVTSIRISKEVIGQIERTTASFVDLFPCLARCLNGGGNYPTVDESVIENRCNWLESLWGS